MKPQRGSSIAGPSLGGLWGRSATGDNGQAAKERSCRYGDGAECRKNISGVPTGEVFFHLTSCIGPDFRGSAMRATLLNRALLKFGEVGEVEAPSNVQC